jgi:hypothetical protein
MPFISLCLGLVFDGVSQQQLEGNAFEVEVACVCLTMIQRTGRGVTSRLFPFYFATKNTFTEGKNIQK